MLGDFDPKLEYRGKKGKRLIFRGFALAQPEGIESVKVRLAGREFIAGYGREHVLADRFLSPLVSDPHFPMVGYRGIVDTNSLPDGTHEMEYIAVSKWGREQVFGRQMITIDNNKRESKAPE